MNTTEKNTKRDLTGRRFGKLTVLRFAGYLKGPSDSAPRRASWLARCDCGREVVRAGSEMFRRKSCGCQRNAHRQAPAGARNPAYKHGHASKRNTTPTYRTWASMLGRCKNPNRQCYPYYGGRGIRVCERWETFENFLADMGERPPGTSIDRTDVNGDYCLENCRWASDETQARNRSNNVMLTYHGKTMTQTDWCKNRGIKLGTLRRRLDLGWSIERALETPGADDCADECAELDEETTYE